MVELHSRILGDEPAEEEEEDEAVEEMESLIIDEKLAYFLEDRPYFYDISLQE